jgi:hypothetical protein
LLLLHLRSTWGAGGPCYSLSSHGTLHGRGNQVRSHVFCKYFSISSTLLTVKRKALTVYYENLQKEKQAARFPGERVLLSFGFRLLRQVDPLYTRHEKQMYKRRWQ